MAFSHIYLIQNLINFKVYVGQAKKPKGRWTSHKWAALNGKKMLTIHKAMREFGIENFSFNIICECETQEETNKEEIFWINFFCARNYNIGYNKALGGLIAPSQKYINAGINNSGAKLSEHNVLEIVKLYYTTNISCKQLALKFGVKSITIYSIITGANWSHLTKIDKAAKAHPIKHTRGQNHSSSKLTDQDVSDIIKLYTIDNITQSAIANIFNIGENTVCSILSGKSWQHITNMNENNNVSCRKNGTNHYLSKLSDNQVIEIVKLYNTGNYSQYDLAEQFKIDRSTISDIISGYTWSNITGIKLENHKPLNIKMTEQNVLDLINLHNTGTYSRKELGAKFNIKHQTVSSIVNGYIWSSITGILPPEKYRKKHKPPQQ